MRRRVLTALAVGAVLLALTVGTYQGLLARRPLPTIDGYYRLLGLHQRAEVTRDAFGIARLEAGDLHDLFFLQGYITAQDRFAQMEAMRRGGTRVFFRGSPEGDLAVALEAYAEGVTKFIGQHSEARALPAEIALSGKRPEPWTAYDPLRILATYLHEPSRSRCVAINADRTVRGAPLLAAELSADAPAPGWYEIGLEGPGIRAIGVSLPGVPGILAGHNGVVAWSLHDAVGGPADLYRSAGTLLSLLAARTTADLAGPSPGLQSGPLAGCVADVRGNVIGLTPFSALDSGDLASAATGDPSQTLIGELEGLRSADVEAMRLLLGRPEPAASGARIVIDLGDLDASKAALSTGQSGHPAAFHYLDQRALWEVGQLHALAWSPSKVPRTEGQLVLRAR